MGSRKRGAALKHKNHAQDCETLISTRDQHPAILPWFLCFGWRPSFRSTGILPRPAAGLLLDVLRMIGSGNRKPCFERSCVNARLARVVMSSTTNVVLLEQRLVARLVLLLDVIEQRTARRHELQKTAP